MDGEQPQDAPVEDQPPAVPESKKRPGCTTSPRDGDGEEVDIALPSVESDETSAAVPTTLAASHSVGDSSSASSSSTLPSNFESAEPQHKRMRTEGGPSSTHTPSTSPYNSGGGGGGGLGLSLGMGLGWGARYQQANQAQSRAASASRERMAQLSQQAADHLTALVALLEAAEPEDLASSQLPTALDIVLRFSERLGATTTTTTTSSPSPHVAAALGRSPFHGQQHATLASSAQALAGYPHHPGSPQMGFAKGALSSPPQHAYQQQQQQYYQAAPQHHHHLLQQQQQQPQQQQFYTYRPPQGNTILPTTTTMASTAPTSANGLAHQHHHHQQQQQQLQLHQQQQQQQQQQPMLSLEYFVLHQTLGTGTFGQVRLCQQRTSGKYFCLKILSKEAIVRLKQTEHVKNEKSILARIAHPFIVKLYATFQDNANLFFLMEYVSGGELFAYIRRHGRLSNDTSRFYAAEIVLAIGYLHGLQIGHRDLKPENLLLDRDGHIKLCDFGFAKVIAYKTGTMCGTPDYIAPEVIRGTGHDKAVDWWSLGVLIYEMLAGTPPFRGSNMMEMFKKIVAAQVEMPAHFDPEARDLIARLLVVDATQRLGGGRAGMQEVMAHPWFAGVDWEALHRRQIRAPINPNVTGEGDSHNFPRYSDQHPQHNKECREAGELFKDF